MRAVERESALPGALAAARREARSAFGDDTLLLEKLIAAPRHVEVQIFGDEFGHIVHIGERECSIQRRHQKVIEETPSTALTPELRDRMTRAAVVIGESLRYSNAGTVEFILDSEGNFYFLEVNTRLQVEHAVTEMVTGVDLVRWQIRVAEGRPLPLTQAEIRFTGHAVEARLYAEVPEADFLPASGDVALWREPTIDDGVRVDSGIVSGDTVSSYYDPLLAKIVVHGEDRPDALRRLERALSKTLLFGIPSNRELLRRLLLHPDHLAGRIDTAFIERHRADLINRTSSVLEREVYAERVADAAIVVAMRRLSLANGRGHWRNNPSRPVLEAFKLFGAASGAAEEDAMRMEVRLVPVSAMRAEAICIAGGAESSHAVELRGERGDDLDVEIDGRRFLATAMETAGDQWWVVVNGAIIMLQRLSPFPEPSSGRAPVLKAGQRGARFGQVTGKPGVLLAPLPGRVAAVHVAVGQLVRAGDPVMVIEAMKMEHIVRASCDGEIVAIYADVGDQARHGSPLLDIRPNEAKGAGV
jgi:acetyl/propionyl-CoA carboxylase alpha subunit